MRRAVVRRVQYLAFRFISKLAQFADKGFVCKAAVHPLESRDVLENGVSRFRFGDRAQILVKKRIAGVLAVLRANRGKSLAWRASGQNIDGFKPELFQFIPEVDFVDILPDDFGCNIFF